MRVRVVRLFCDPIHGDVHSSAAVREAPTITRVSEVGEVGVPGDHRP